MRRKPASAAKAQPRRARGAAGGSTGGGVDAGTARKVEQLKEALRARIEPYLTGFENSPISMALIDTDGINLLVNATHARKLGISDPAQMVGQSFERYVHPDDQAATHASIKRLLATGMDVGERRYVRQDGTIMYALFAASVVRDADGQIVALLSQAQDITDRKLAEAALRASEERLRSTADAMMDPLFILTPVRDEHGTIADLEYRYVNQAGERLLNRPSRDIIGHRYLKLFPPVTATATGIWDTYVTAIQTGTPAKIATPYLDKNGMHGSFEISATPGADGLIVSIRDVTETRQAQEALRASEERFRSMADAMMDPLFILTPVRDEHGTIADLEYRYVNQAGERLLRMPAHDIIGHRQFEFFPSARGDTVQDAYYQAIDTGTPTRLDSPYLNEHGVQGRFEISITPGTEGLIVTARDVTEARQAQEALRASEERFRTAVESMLDPFVLLRAVRDEDGRIIDYVYEFANGAACQYLGLPRGELLGKRMLTVRPRQEATGLLPHYERVVETGEPLVLDDFIFDYSEGGQRHRQVFEIRAHRVGNGLAYTWREVTDRYQANEALHDSEERFRASVEALPDGFAVLSAIRDSSGAITDFRYQYINEAGCRMDQRSREDTVGHTLAELFRASVTSGLLAAYAQVAETGEQLTREDTSYEDVYGGRGLTRAFDIRAAKLGDGIVAIWRDVAERRRAEETISRQAAALQRSAAELEHRVQRRTAELQAANARLQAANKDLEGFAYSIAHDMRGPLRAINSQAQILAQEHRRDLDADARHRLDRVAASAVRMGELADNLLDFFQAGRNALMLAPLDMNTLVDEVLTQLREQPQQAVTVTVGDLEDAYGDRMLIRQVWVNLIGNALKFTSGVAQPRIWVESEPGDAEVIYRVRDNGAGFDMAYAGRLFRVFERLHGEDYPGTGIGLALVARIVERHGGRVWAEGTPGHGACFSFTLPAKPPADKEPADDHVG